MSEMRDWEEVWKENISEMALRTTVEYWDKRADDYSDLLDNSRFSHGESILGFCRSQHMITSSSRVLDIGSGPGSVAIPFARIVQHVMAIEPAEQMGKKLRNNAEKEGLHNIHIVRSIWQDFETGQHEKTFDCVICCHSLWHFPDISDQVLRMHRVAKGYCCIAGEFGKDEDAIGVYKDLGVRDSAFDQFHALFNLFNARNLAPNIEILPYFTIKPVNSAIAAMELVVQKYHPLSEKDREIINEYVLKQSTDGIIRKRSLMGMMWWKVGS
jgi:ubiquinone/menaquinone biosynthesis C-methylase UbiE